MISDFTWSLKRLNVDDEYCDLKPGVTIIGRIPNADITLSSLSISRKHCKIVVSPDESYIHIEDLGSGNGTFVENVKLTPKLLVKLKEDVNIGIGTNVDYRGPTLKPDEHYHYKLIRRKRKNIDTIDLTDAPIPVDELDVEIIEKADEIEILSSDDDEPTITTNESDKSKELIRPNGDKMIESTNKNNRSTIIVDNRKVIEQNLNNSVNETINSIYEIRDKINDPPSQIADDASAKSNNNTSNLNRVNDKTFTIHPSLSRALQVMKNTADKAIITRLHLGSETASASEKTDEENASSLPIEKKICRVSPSSSGDSVVVQNAPEKEMFKLPLRASTSKTQNQVKQLKDMSKTVEKNNSHLIEVKRVYKKRLSTNQIVEIPIDPEILKKLKVRRGISLAMKMTRQMEQLKDLRKNKLKEIALKNLNNQDETNESSKVPNSKPTVLVKNTSTNRGSFLANLYNLESQHDRHKGYTEEKSDMFVSIEDSILMNRILFWKPSWLTDYCQYLPAINENRPTFRGRHYGSFNNYEEYRRLLSDSICKDIWKKMCKTYNDKRNTFINTNSSTFKVMHPLDSSNTGSVNKIHLQLCKLNVYQDILEIGTVAVVTLNNWCVSHFAIVDKIIKYDKNGWHRIELFILIEKDIVINTHAGAMLDLHCLCNISEELMLLNAVYTLNGSPLCNNIVSPEYSHFPVVDYSPLCRTAEQLDYMQVSALCTNIASIYLGRKSLQIVEGLPGTGKTMLICRIVFEYLLTTRIKKKILICGPTETGVDNILKVFKDLQEQEYPEMSHIKILRIGKTNDIDPSSLEYTITYKTQQMNNSTSETMTPVYTLNDNLENNFIMEADIIFGTTMFSGKLKQLKNKIQWCLIDDASLLYEPEVLYVVNLNIFHLVLVGNQTQSPDPTRLESLYAFGSVFSRISKYVTSWEQNIILSLKIQHRMNPDIQTVAELFTDEKCYDNMFKDDLNYVLPRFRLFMKVRTANEDVTNHVLEKSIYMAKFAWAMYNYLLKANTELMITILVASAVNIPSIRLTVTTLDKQKKMPIQYSTVQNFNGKESDVVIVCDYENEIMRNDNLLKIALTRAKYGLYIFCDMNYMSDKNLFAVLHHQAGVLSAIRYISKYPGNDSLMPDSASVPFSEEYFSRAMM